MEYCNSMLSSKSLMSYKRLLALINVKKLTQTSLESIKLDQQIITDHLLVKSVLLCTMCNMYIELVTITLPSSN